MSKPRIKSSYYPPDYPPTPSAESYLRWCRMTGASSRARTDQDWWYVKNIKRAKP